MGETSGSKSRDEDIQPVYDLDAKCPLSGKIKQVQVTAQDLRATLQHAPHDKFYQLVGSREAGLPGCVADVLKHPTTIWADVRAYYKGGRAYVGKPGYDFDLDGRVIDAPEKMVFHVLVNPYAFVFEWGWEPEDPEHDGWPLDYRTRYRGGKIWPH